MGVKMAIIQNLNIYDLEETLIASGYAMVEDYSEEKIKKEISELKEKLAGNHLKRAWKLTKAPLINQSTLQVAIQPCNESEKDAFNITEASLNNKNGFELSCMTLIGKIYDMMKWSFDTTYKCVDYIKYKNLLIFNLKLSTELLIVE